MTAQRLGQRPVSVSTYDVAAFDSEADRDFIRHVALLEEERSDVLRGNRMAVAHMGPPLARGENRGPIQAIATADLKVSEINKIRVFVDELFQEMKAEQSRSERRYNYYIIMPHVVSFRQACKNCLPRRAGGVNGKACRMVAAG
jgi:hypothetical protein